MKILLIGFPARKGSKKHIPWHYGFFKDILEGEGHTVDIIDNQVEGYSVPELVDIALKNDYALVGTGGIVTVYNELKLFSETLKQKKKSVTIVVGGQVTADHEFVIDSCPIDIIVLGEGEITLPKIVSCIEEKGDLSAVPGIVFKRNNEMIITEHEKERIVLDELPALNLNNFKIEKYDTSVPKRYIVDEKSKRLKNDGHKRLSLNLTRGCPYSCFFCYRHIKGYRFYGEERIESIIKDLKQKKFSFLYFTDENICANMKLLKKLCEQTKKHDIYWCSSARADGITEETVKMLRDGNCVQLLMGVESFDKKILETLDKKTLPHQNINAINLCYQYGIFYLLNCILGAPGEDRETILNTRRGIWSSYFVTGNIDCAYLNPYPGSPSYYYGLDNGYFRDKKMVHEQLANKHNLVINFSKISKRELTAWYHEIQFEFAINYMVKNKTLRNWRSFLKKTAIFLQKYAALLLSQPVDFVRFNIYFVKGFSYWLRPLPKLKWNELYEHIYRT